MAGPSFRRVSVSEDVEPPCASIKKEGFTVLHNGEGDIVADIVFVHGLQGHPKNTWTKRLSRQPDGNRPKKFFKVSSSKKVAEPSDIGNDRSIFWPQDLLPQKVKNIRILSYGYDSKIARFIQSANRNGIYHYAENLLSALERVRSDSSRDVKIIFVAHSLGGIIVKEVLRQSSKHTHQPHLLSVFNSTYGIIFFGCPHQGSAATEWGLVAANLAKLAGMSPNTDLLRSLGMDSQALRMIGSDFSVFLRDNAFKVHSFREEKGMTGVAGISGKVVEDVSSIIGDAAEGKEGINANHQDMCRFDSLEDEGFIKVAGVISRHVRELEALQNIRNDAAREARNSDCKQDVVNLSEREKKCLQSFVLADHSAYRHRIPKRHPGTLEWILEHNVYQKWDSEDAMSTFLWVSGNPGCGKTVISAFLLDHLEERAKITGFKVAYFFCDDKEDRQKSARSLLRGLIHQLITATPGLIKHAMGYFATHGAQMLGSLDILWQIFISVVTDPLSNGTYIILDALDECEKTSRDDLLRRLGDYFRLVDGGATNRYLKVLITSRPYREIQILLSRQPVIRLKAEDEEGNINSDISSFISHKVDELADVCSYDFDLKERVRTALQTGADGMFLWVSIVAEELFDTPISAVSETLASVPNSLDGLYTHLLKRLDGRKAKIARNILMWVVTSPRPMSVTELAIACSVKSSHTSVASIENALLEGFINDIALCGPILKIQKEPKKETIHLVHQSVKDFLLSPDISDSLPGFDFPAEQANHELAITCLTYLSFSDFDHGPLGYCTPDNWEHPVLQKHMFLSFAGAYWPQFVRCTDDSHPRIWQHFWRLAQSQEQLSLAFQLFIVHNLKRHFGYSKLVDALYVLAYFGFRSVVGRILEQGSNADARNELDNNLYVAASNGHEAVVQLFLEKGADANARDGLHGNALQAAACRGHQSVVRLLLERGADVNAQGGYYGTALQAAAYRGYQSVVHLLLERGADIDAQEKGHCTALRGAAWGGHQPVVHLLLERGADVNAQGSCGSALQAAACRGHQPLVHLLLERGADVDAPGSFYGTALQAAAHYGHQSVVHLLLERGADVDAYDEENSTALQGAARGGH